MAQLFAPSSNTLAKVSLLCVAGAPVIAFYVGSTVSRSPFATNSGTPLQQPIPFSHKHHAYELGIDCRYCHNFVETGAVAGVPSTETCMSCHSQIWTNSPLLEPLRKSWNEGTPISWTKVNKLPEFVYFNHSIHIARGISCNECHGPVTKMQITFKGKPLSMAWCLECHREPEKFLRADPKRAGERPQDQSFALYQKAQRGEKLTTAEYNLLVGKKGSPSAEEVAQGKELVEKFKVEKKQLADCWVCHR
jgi:hypothetical protein